MVSVDETGDGRVHGLAEGVKLELRMAGENGGRQGMNCLQMVWRSLLSCTVFMNWVFFTINRCRCAR